MAEVKIIGVDSLLSKLNEISKANATKKGLTNACLRVEREAKKKCPVDDGDLRGSITHVVKDNKGEIGTNKEYGPYVEFGTGLYAENGMGRKTPWAYIDEKTGQTIWTAGQHPQPFLHPALSENKEKIQDDMKEAINEELRRVCK